MSVVSELSEVSVSICLVKATRVGNEYNYLITMGVNQKR